MLEIEQPARREMLVDAIVRTDPDVVVDTVDFPACCLAGINALPPVRVVATGPEPDLAYETRHWPRGPQPG